MGSLRVGRHTVQISSEEKVLFPKSRISKGDLIAYYRAIAPTIIPYLRNRPLVMNRYPTGIAAGGFVQQAASDYFPEWVPRASVEKENGKITHVLCNNAATLVYLVNQNMVTPHVWLSRVDRPRMPDQIVFDLDPSGKDFDVVRGAAHAIGAMLKQDGLEPYVMTTGSSGLHVRAAIRRARDYDEVRAYARRLAADLAERHANELTIEQRKDKRRGRVYLDTGRNAYAQTAVVPYAVRAREGAPVAVPLTWEELDEADMSPRRFTIHDVPARIEARGDPMRDMLRGARPATPPT